MPIDIDTLNGPQREAVVTTQGPLLVLAGAGSGKTRVLTYRIANILEQDLAAPWEILAITFTNKAAAEMRERLAQLVGARSRGMWVSTFHSMCVRMLRADAERLGFTKNFTIYDTDDLKRLYKDIMAELNIDPKRFPVNQLMNRISQAKNDLVTPGNFDAHDPVGKVAERVYERLQERLRAANAFDFDDLLLYGYLLLKNHADVREAYQDRFRYLMVDEYQDTNRAQYAITQLLAAKRRNIMVVGDDDQSIYSWRGADLRNILEFESDYPEAKVVKLEQNYRSVGNILAAANAVIANNQHRKEKRLFTDSGDGEKISVYLATDERDEGRWIAGEIEKRHGAGMSYNQIAVFYRTNAQSRALEEALLAQFSTLAARGIEPVLRAPDAPVFAQLSRAGIARVFGNILSNVSKYAEGALEIELSEAGALKFINAAPMLDEVRVGRIVARIDEENAASAHVARRLGMKPRRTMSAAAIRHSWVFVRSCSRMMRSMRSAGVCRMSRNENIPALFTSTSMAAPSRRTASHSSAAASMRARSISTIRTSGRNPAAGDAAFRTPPSGPAPAASISPHTVSSDSRRLPASTRL